MSAYPQNSLRRSQLYRWHHEHGAHFANIANLVVVNNYDSERGDGPGLCDLSLLPRTGLKGPDAIRLLQSTVDDTPMEPNQSILTSDDTRIARLSLEEFLLLGSVDFETSEIAMVDQALAATSGMTYSLPRADSHCLFALKGRDSPEVLAKLCAIDLRPGWFATGAVAQTSMARVNAIIIQHHFAAEPGFFLLADSASTEYLWTCLLDALQEFDGGAVGLDSFRTMQHKE